MLSTLHSCLAFVFPGSFSLSRCGNDYRHCAGRTFSLGSWESNCTRVKVALPPCGCCSAKKVLPPNYIPSEYLPLSLCRPE